MNHIKKIVIILIALLIIIAIVICAICIPKIINSNSDNSQGIDYEEIEEEYDGEKYEQQLNEKVIMLQSENEFFALEKQISNFILYNKAGNNVGLFKLLKSDYIKQNQITEDNVISKLKDLFPNSEEEFYLEKVYTRDSLDKPIYYIEGYLGNNAQAYYMVVDWDLDNETFCIYPINKEEYEKYITEKLKEENNFSIEKNEYNNLKVIILSNEEKAEKYMRSYIRKASYHSSQAYQIIDSTYREKKFSSFEEYREYLINKKDELISFDNSKIKSLSDFNTEEEYNEYINNLKIGRLEKYSFEEIDGTRRCICIDNYNNYYIFNITSAMQYTIILDVYTIDLPEIAEQYQSTDEKGKVQINIQKVIQAVNDNDYKYLYSKLDETFKNNNFSNIDKFKDFINTKFYNLNKIQNATYNQDGNIYICDLQISNENETKTVRILIRLLEDANYVISFSI